MNEGGHLASITSDDIKEKVVEGMNRKGLDRIWIGGNDKNEEGVWKWTDDRPWEFTSWAQGEPNNLTNEHCAEMGRDWGLKGVGMWNDLPCHHELGFLCGKKTRSGKNDQYLV